MHVESNPRCPANHSPDDPLMPCFCEAQLNPKPEIQEFKFNKHEIRWLLEAIGYLKQIEERLGILANPKHLEDMENLYKKLKGD